MEGYWLGWRSFLLFGKCPVLWPGLAHGWLLGGQSAGEEFRVMDPDSEKQPEAPFVNVILPQRYWPVPLSLLCLVAAAFWFPNRRHICSLDKCVLRYHLDCLHIIRSSVLSSDLLSVCQWSTVVHHMQLWETQNQELNCDLVCTENPWALDWDTTTEVLAKGLLKKPQWLRSLCFHSDSCAFWMIRLTPSWLTLSFPLSLQPWSSFNSINTAGSHFYWFLGFLANHTKLRCDLSFSSSASHRAASLCCLSGLLHMDLLSC